MILKLRLLVICISGFLIFLMVSCSSPKGVVYFDNLKDTTFRSLFEDEEPVIRANDILSITISSLNPEATIIFNSPNLPTINSAISTSSSIQQSVGYLVAKNGNIQFPMLGEVKAAGFSKKQFTDTLTAILLARKLLVDPIVTVRFLNFRVTVLGEVARPNVITVPNEKITILEALGMAGDITIYAKRDNVLLIRNENGNKIIKRINLNRSDILNSPYYYLKTNDVIYVEPNSTRIAATSNSRQLLPIVLSGLSFFAIIVDRIVR